MNTLLLVPFLAGSLASWQAPAGSASHRAPRPRVAAAFSHLQSRHGPSWRILVDENTGFARFLYGGRAQAEGPASTDADFLALARAAVADTEMLLGVDVATLDEDGVMFLPLHNAGTTDKMTVQLRQRFAGVPVMRGTVNVLFDLQGRWLSIDSAALPVTSRFDTTPGLTPAQAIAAADALFAAEKGLLPAELSEPALAIEQVTTPSGRQGVLVWEVEARRVSEGSRPLAVRYRIDARSGAMVTRTDLVRHLDVSGTVTSLVTPGTAPDTASNPPQAEPMPFLDVTDGTNVVQTDEHGNFVLQGVNAPVNLTVRYAGQFALAVDATGPNYSLTVTATQSTGNVIAMNPLGLEDDTAEANAYNWMTRLRQWIKSVNPADDVMERRFRANCNLGDVGCSAFWNGIAVNFFLATACVNTAYSSVVVHEMGHWLNDRYDSGEGTDGFGEGNADTLAMYVLDDNIIARDFYGPGIHERDGENMTQLCPDDTTTCYPQVHLAGEVLMGALWKVRRNLKNRRGEVAGGTIANTLWNSWMNAYNAASITPTIELQWLTLDDNNGDIEDGTPNFVPIDLAFREQGFPGVELRGYRLRAPASGPSR